jgi:hypothetical protein
VNARPIGICDLTGPMQQFCTSLVNARAEIESANCIAQGESCEVLSMYYTPAQWFVTNKAFARETVRDFYHYEAADACAGEPDRLRRAEEENEIVKKTCVATQFELLKEAIQYARLICRMLISLLMSFYSIIVDLFLCVIYSAQNKDLSGLLSDAAYHIENIIRHFVEFFKQMFNLLISFIHQLGGAAEMIAVVAVWICKIVSLIVRVVIEWFLCFVFRGLASALFDIIDVIAITINDIAGAFGAKVNLAPWTDFKMDVDQFFENLPCHSSNPMKHTDITDTFDAAGETITGPIKEIFQDDEGGCSFPQDWKDEDAYGHAFLATRCWVNPSLGDLLGDDNTLACSASDTCIRDGYGEDLGVCESCDFAVDPALFARYGCDTLLKKCKCGVPLNAKTSCIRNSDCFDTIPCSLYASAGGSSYGTVDCIESCRSQAVCLVQDTAINGIQPTGQCACILDPPVIHTCDDSGMVVNMAVQRDMCFVALDHSLAGTIGTFNSEIIQQSALAVAPCALLEKSEEHLTCQSIQSPLGLVSKHIIGSSFVSFPAWGAFQRKILWQEDDKKSEDVWVNLAETLLADHNFSWAETGVCQDLVLKHRDTSDESDWSVTDRHALRNCVKWRSVGFAAKIMYALPRVDDRVLVSWKHMVASVVGELESLLDGNHNDLSRYAEFAYFSLSQIEGAEYVTHFIKRLGVMALRWIGTVDIAQTLQDLKQNKTSVNVVPNLTETAALWAMASPEAMSAVTSLAEDYLQKCFMKNQTNGASSWHPSSAPPSSPFAPPATTTTATAPNSSQPSVVTSAKRTLLQSVRELGNDWPVDWSTYVLKLNGGNESLCDLWDITKTSVSTMFNSTMRYYAEGFTSRENISTVITDNLMKLASAPKNNIEQRKEYIENAENTEAPDDNIAVMIVKFFVGICKKIVGLDTEGFLRFFYPDIPLEEQIKQDAITLPRIMYELTVCNTENVMLCNSAPRALIPSIVICVVFLYILSYALFLSSGTTQFLMVFVLPSLIMWYSYGYSPFCFPMIPTCFMADVAIALNSTVPARIEWPPMLIFTEKCSLYGIPFNESLKGQVNCFRSCTGDELGFKSYEDPIAWFLCSISQDACHKAATTLRNYTVLAERFASSVEYSKQVIAFGDRQASTAHHICAVMTSFYVTPIVFLAIWLSLMVFLLLRAAVVIFFKVVILLLTTQNSAPLETQPDENDDARQ